MNVCETREIKNLVDFLEKFSYRFLAKMFITSVLENASSKNCSSEAHRVKSVRDSLQWACRLHEVFSVETNVLDLQKKMARMIHFRRPWAD